MRNRNEIPEAYKWNFADIYPTPEDWEKAYAECEAQIPSLAALKGTLGRSAEDLCHAYETVSALHEKMARLGSYAFLGTAIDGGDTAALRRAGLFSTLSVKAGAALAFFDPELTAIPEDKLAGFLAYLVHREIHYPAEFIPVFVHMSFTGTSEESSQNSGSLK